MQGYEYGLSSPRPNRLRNSLLRPQSQHRSSSMSHQDSLKKTSSSKLDNNRQSIQLTATNEYYMQEGGARRQPFRESLQSNKSGLKAGREEVQNLENARKFFIQRLQRWMLELRQQIHKQSTQVFNLERIIEHQNKEIQTKSSIIKVLISKLQNHTHAKPADKPQPPTEVPWRRIQDIETKISLITAQLQEERDEINGKLELLAGRVVKHFGKEVWKLKSNVFQFMKEKERKMDEIGAQMKAVGSEISEKLGSMERSIQSLKEGVKSLSEDSFSKDNASQTTQSKDSISLTSHKTEQAELRKEDSMFSDYFFYPAEREMPTVRAIEQLVKEREELPIRVFTDSSGRLKYWESRTFLFDRKGNFAMPSAGELAVLEQRGWIKLVAD